MDYGMPTLIEHETLQETVALCRVLGLSFVEVDMSLPAYQCHILQANALRSYRDGGLYFTLHLDGGLNVWDFNPLVSKAYLDTALWAITLAQEVGIPILNMHMHGGDHLSLPDGKVFLFERYEDLYMESTLRFREACERAIGKSGIKICIENCGGYTGFQMRAIGALLESDVFGLTLDIGHSHGAGMRDEAFILRHGDRLWHMHVHDAIGHRNHLAIGTGEIDMRDRLRLASEHGCRCVLETKTAEGLSASVAALRRLYS